MYFIFTEDEKGKLGYLGQKYYSYVQAQDKADEYEGVTHIIRAENLTQAKRELRNRLVKEKRDLGILYKNVRSK